MTGLWGSPGNVDGVSPVHGDGSAQRLVFLQGNGVGSRANPSIPRDRAIAQGYKEMSSCRGTQLIDGSNSAFKDGSRDPIPDHVARKPRPGRASTLDQVCRLRPSSAPGARQTKRIVVRWYHLLFGPNAQGCHQPISFLWSAPQQTKKFARTCRRMIRGWLSILRT